MPCPRAAAGLWHACALSWTYEKNIKKNYMKKDCCNLQYFKETNYKDNLRIKTLKKTERKKIPCRKTL
jgi:hypothetical protein